MRTIERLSKIKDVADLIYRTLHRELTQELVAEYKYLSGQDFSWVGPWGCVVTNYKLFYDEASNPASIFNSLFERNFKRRVYHVCISKRIFYRMREQSNGKWLRC